MNESNSFDNQVRQKMEKISSKPMYGSWDTFHQKLVNADSNVPEISEKEFDLKLKNKLAGIKPHQPSAHWEKLKYKLETIELFRKKIVLHKLKELIAVCLFLFTFYNLATHGLLNDSLQHKTHFAHGMLKMRNSGIQDVNSTPTVKNNRGISLGTPNTQKRSLRYQSEQTLLPVAITESPFLPQKISGITSEALPKPLEGQTFVMPIASRPLEESFVLPGIQSNPYSIMAMILPMNLINNFKAQSFYRVGVFVSHVNNFILTPFDKVYSVPKFSNSTRDQAFGLTLGKKIGKLELEGGISYSHLSYDPVKIKEAYASASDVYFETSLTKINFDLIKIPVQVKYHFVDRPKWRVYSMLGAGFNTILHAEYNIEENLVKGKPSSPLRFNSEGPRLGEKPFTKGLLGEGNLAENYFIDVHMGFGMERKIHENFHLFLQPSYHAFLISKEIGVGPNQDKLNSMHIQVGIKQSLR